MSGDTAGRHRHHSGLEAHPRSPEKPQGAGGQLVVNAIRKEEADKNELLRLDYPQHLWLEKEIKSVANVTRKDVEEFLSLAAAIPLRPEVQEYINWKRPIRPCWN